MIAIQGTGQIYSGSGTTATVSVTTAGTDTGMLFYVVTSAGVSVSSVTYAGFAATQVATNVGSPVFKTYVYKLINPTTGANNAVATISGSGECYLCVAQYSGVDQVVLSDANITNSRASGTSLVTTLTTITDNSWTFLGVLADMGALAASTGSTLRGSILNTAVGMFDSNAAITPVGATSMTVTTGSGRSDSIMLSIKPKATASTGSGSLLLTGVGV